MTRKRPNGEGTIELHHAKWRVRVVVEGRRVTLGRFDSEERARRMLRAHLAEVDAGSIIAPGALTLATLGVEWLDARELHGSRTRARVKDIHNERRLWERHVRPSALAALAVQSIRVRDVEAFAACFASERRWRRSERPRGLSCGAPVRTSRRRLRKTSCAWCGSVSTKRSDAS